MNPLSPLTYYRRHKWQTLLLLVLISLTTLGIYVMVSMVYPILEHTSLVVLGPLSHFSLVYPAVDLSPDPAVVAHIRTHPDVARVIPENGSELIINVPSLVSLSTSRVLALSEADVPYLMDVCDLRLREGRLPKPRTNELLLSEELADALGLHVGDHIDRSVNERYYFAIPSPLVLVGILESEPTVHSRQRARLAIVSYEYLASHELYAPRQSGLLVVAQQGRKAAVDDFLETAIPSPRTQVETHKQRSEYLANVRRILNLILGTVDCLVAVVIALVVGMINQMALTQRLADLGVLHAIGYHKNRLIRRLTLETAVVAGIGWLAGLMLSWLTLAWLKTSFYEPRGVDLNLANLAPLWFAVPIPLTVIGFVAFSIVRIFARLDPVAIIERGKLGVEARAPRRAARSLPKPLSAWTFFQRHRRRGLVLIAAIGLMILGVAFPVFFFSPVIEAQKPFLLNYLRYVGLVQPAVGSAVDPTVVGHIRSHSDVAWVIPATLLHLSVSIPPVSTSSSFVYGVSEGDLPFLVDLFGLYLKEGHLPRPRSSELVLSEAQALNRDLHVGDTIGRPVDERDQNIVTEMVVVGILGRRPLRPGLEQARSQQALSNNDVSLGFASAEYLDSHELYASRPTHLFVVPTEGSKAELDSWLEENIASTRTLVETYDKLSRDMDQATRDVFLLFAAVEGIIAVVTTMALAALNYIFFTQRRDEFGILHAVGRSRPWLVFRTTKETASVVTVAWLIGAVVCVVSLLYAQANVYAPKGLSLNFANLTPWMFTLPIPVAVVAAGVGTIAWMLSKLDPVSIVERRTS